MVYLNNLATLASNLISDQCQTIRKQYLIVKSPMTFKAHTIIRRGSLLPCQLIDQAN